METEENNNSEEDLKNGEEKEMARKKVKQMPRQQQKAVMKKLKSSTKKKRMTPRKRIYNPQTKSYYEIRQRTTKHGQKGQIKGTWKPPRTIKSYPISGNIKKSEIDKALERIFKKSKPKR